MGFFDFFRPDFNKAALGEETLRALESDGFERLVESHGLIEGFKIAREVNDYLESNKPFTSDIKLKAANHLPKLERSLREIATVDSRDETKDAVLKDAARIDTLLEKFRR